MHKVRHDKTLKEKRRARVRSKLHGSASRPRLNVLRSNKHLSLQVIDDDKAKTLLSTSDMSKKKKMTGTKTQRAQKIAEDLLAKLKTKKIKNLVFDRGHYKFHGRIKAVSDVLKKGGIQI